MQYWGWAESCLVEDTVCFFTLQVCTLLYFHISIYPLVNPKNIKFIPFFFLFSLETGIIIYIWVLQTVQCHESLDN